MAADHSPTHFELFDLAPSFDVDLARLDERYRDSQRMVHPDRFVNASDQERRLSMQRATQLNEAYQTLRDPLKRGRYLLELDQRDFEDEHQTNRDTAFLVEQMELREALGEVREAADAFAALGGIMDRIEHDIENLIVDLQQQFSQGDTDSLVQAAESLTKLQFFKKLQDEAMEMEVMLEDELA